MLGSASLASLNPRRSLAGRLVLIVIGAVITALAVAAGLLAWREVDRYVADKRAALQQIAQVIASSSSRAVANNDENAAEATLRSIAHNTSLVYAAIMREDGSILAEQGLGLRLDQDIDLDGQQKISIVGLATTRTVKAAWPILDNASTIGRVVLVADTGDLGPRMAQVALTSGLAGLLAIGIGVFVSLRLQRSVTRPLAALARTMDSVRNSHDFTQRAVVTTRDEVGALAGTFNELLQAVNERDRRIARHGAHLEEEVRTRTVDLNEAKQAAEAASAAKSTFLATMSHEIRTPMNGMLVMAELLAGSDLPPQQARYASVIAQSGQSLLAIINDILDFAKIEAGKLEVERIPTNPRDVADTAITLFAEGARMTGLDVAAVIDPDVPASFLGDPVRLGQVIGNFISNAIKFTKSGHVRLTMSVVDRGMTAPGPTLRIGVDDTGIGIPQDKLERIFSAFTQADTSTTRQFGGTGLGLSIAERLVAAMGGRVGVESEPGIGSTFWAELPIEEGADAEHGPERAPGVPETVFVGSLGEATEAMLAADLSRIGFRLDAEAAACWIVDAASLVRRGERPGSVQRIIAVGSLGDPLVAEALQAGLADEALRWPVTQAEWQPLLRSIAQGSASEQTPASTPRAISLPVYSEARVLVADDSAVNREVAKEALARFGIAEVVCVEDGQAAVDATADHSFDLIFMDGSMPVLDGFAAARAIRQRETSKGLSRVPIIALTAQVAGIDAVAWQRAGMDALLLKPFTLTKLAETLAEHLRAASPISVQESTTPNRHELFQSDSPIESLLDDQVISNLLELGGVQFFGRVLNLYLAHAPQTVKLLDSALSAESFHEIAQAAHSLKSMSLNIGAARLADIAGTIEQAAREGRICPSSSAKSVKIVLEQTQMELRKVLELSGIKDYNQKLQA